MSLFDNINTFFIEKVATQIAKIGAMTPTTIHILTVYARMYEDIAEINREVAKLANKSMPEVKRIYSQALNEIYYDERFERALEETPLPEHDKRALENYAEAVSRQTADTFVNLSNTTAVSQTYRKVVDNAILAVSSGLGDYQSMMRKSMRELGGNGLQVVYESGYRRRMDSAIRQNILDGVRQIQQHASDTIGERLNYDAKEISVHLNSAPDHEPVQGHIFSNEEFEKLQTDQPSKDVDGRDFPAMQRPIGEWNCRHFVFSFSTKYSKRRYSTEQLDEMITENAKGCEINGKHYTNYEATQLMRSIETDIRRQKDIAVAAKAANDVDLQREAQIRINALSKKYDNVVNASGLSARRNRMVVEGFKPMRIKQ